MDDKPKYYDIRSEFWKEHFEEAMDYEVFLETSNPLYADKWRAAEKAIPRLTTGETARVEGFGRKLNVLVYCGAWCGDCSRQVPMIKRICDAAGPEVSLRLIDRDASPRLTDEVRILGAMRVPVVVFLTEDFHEVGRLGDRLLSAYRRKRDNEMGAACDSGVLLPSAEDLAIEITEWLDQIERMLIMVRIAPPLRARYDD